MITELERIEQQQQKIAALQATVGGWGTEPDADEPDESEPTQIPEWEISSHEELDLATVSHEDLGLDPYNFDDPLVKAIYKAQIAAQEHAEPAVQPENIPQPGLIPSVKAAIDRGFHVFALTPKDKIPLPGSQGFKDSKEPLDPLALEPWNEDPNRNIGINLGASDLCVLDFDKPDSIPAWLSETKTYKVKTGKGVHVYFRGARKTTKLYLDGNLVGDVKSQGGYVLAAGSIHPSGAVYTVVDDSEILPTPDRVSELLRQEEKAPVNVSPDGPPIPYGSHDTELTRIAGLLRNAWMNVQDIEEHLIRVCERRCEGYGSDYKEMCRKIAKSIGKKPVGQAPAPVILGGQVVGQAQSAAPQNEIPIIDDPSDHDPRFEMKGDHFETKVYEDMAQRFTPYPNPGNGDWVSLAANKLVHGTSIPLAFVREPLKAIVLHALDGKLIHPAHPKLSLRGNYFSLAESEGGKTTGLEFAIEAAEVIGKAATIHFENLFRYKSETTFIRSFTPEGTIKRDSDGNIKSGEPGHPSQFLYIKEGNLVANASDYFAAVVAMLTNLYDQTEAGTESMTNGNFTARSVKASTVMCFTPSDFKATFGGKGTIGGGVLNRWAMVNPPPITEYDSKDWEQLSGEEIQQAVGQLTAVVFNLRNVGAPIVLTEEPGAAKIRLEAKAMLKKAGKVGKRLMDYFMREQVAQAATAVDGRLVMTTEQAQYAKRWVEAQMECRLNHWPSDANNQIEAMEHAIRKAVTTHHVSETRLKDACNFYREGSGGWFVFSTAVKNAVASEAIKLTGKTRKGAKTYCPRFCAVHPAIKEDEKPRK